MCWEKDTEVRRFLENLNMKRVIVNYHSTVENICADFSDRISGELKKIKGSKFKSVTVRISETPNSSAEKTVFP